MRKLSNLSNLDKLIIYNFKRIEAYLSGICFIIILALILLPQLIFYGGTLVVAVIVAAIGVYLFYKICYILFYDSIFGKNAGIYLSLPVSAAETVISRIYVALLCVVIVDGITVLSIIIRGWIGDVDFGDMESMLSVLREVVTTRDGGTTSIVIPLMLLYSLVASGSRYSLILLGVCVYQSLSAERKNGLAKIIIAAAVLALIYMADFVVAQGTKLMGITSLAIELAVENVVLMCVMVLAAKGTIYLLENKYELA